MPDYLQVANLGLVGALLLFVWRLPEIVGIVFNYLRERQGARDREFDKLAQVFREDREKILAVFREELRFERQESAKQHETVLTAIERHVCGFVEQHTRQTLVAPLGTVDVCSAIKTPETPKSSAGGTP